MSKDGREVPDRVTLGEFFRDGRRYFTAIARDITERRRAEQEKAGLLLREREARERAEAAIRTREEVLAIVSHDLSNPLNTIAMGASALKEFAADEATRERYVQMIQRAIQRMNRLIEDLLDVVRLEGGQKLALDLAPLDLAPVLAELADSFRAQAEPRQQAFVCEVEPGLPPVMRGSRPPGPGGGEPRRQRAEVHARGRARRAAGGAGGRRGAGRRRATTGPG